MPGGEQATRAQVARVEQALARLDTIVDDGDRSAAMAAVRELFAMYGEGLGRIVRRVTAEGHGLSRSLTDDELVSHLLMLHELHPDDLRDRVERALDEVRPYMQSHGGNVTLVSVDGSEVTLRLDGSCQGCAASTLTMRTRVEEAIARFAPEVTAVCTADDAPSARAPLPILTLDPTSPPAAVAPASPAPARVGAASTAATGEQCELCGATVGEGHRHLLDVEARRLACACRACALLFDDGTRTHGRYRAIPDTVRRATDFMLDDATWAEFAIPVDMAFFFQDTKVGRVVALYPGPMGAAESQLPLSAWDALVARNPLLADLAPDVEALLVNRTRGGREQFVVPIDQCYALVGLIRRHWHGLGGGDAVWREIDRFFGDLRRRAHEVRQHGTVSSILAGRATDMQWEVAS